MIPSLPENMKRVRSNDDRAFPSPAEQSCDIKGTYLNANQPLKHGYH